MVNQKVLVIFDCTNWVHLRSNSTFIANKTNNTKAQQNFVRILCYFGADIHFVSITYTATMLYTLKENKRTKREEQQHKRKKAENANKNKNYNKLSFDRYYKSKIIPFDGESADMVAKPNVKEIFDVLKHESDSRITKNIQSTYWAVRLQAKMCDEFFKHLGCTNENEDNNSVMSEMVSMENGDKLWFNTRVKGVLSYDKPCEVMDNIVDTVTRLLLWKCLSLVYRCLCFFPFCLFFSPVFDGVSGQAIDFYL